MWDGSMLLSELLVDAALQTREEEVRRALRIAEAQLPAEQSGTGSVQRGRIEQEKEQPFQDVRGWPLSSQPGALVETPAAVRRRVERSMCAGFCRRAA